MQQVSPILFSVQDVDTCSERDFIHVWDLSLSGEDKNAE